MIDSTVDTREKDVPFVIARLDKEIAFLESAVEAILKATDAVVRSPIIISGTGESPKAAEKRCQLAEAILEKAETIQDCASRLMGRAGEVEV